MTGGLTGLGLACAAGLVDAGARHLTLLGRRAPSASAVSAIEALRQRGVSVTVVSADVADADALGRALAHVLPAPTRQVVAPRCAAFCMPRAFSTTGCSPSSNPLALPASCPQRFAARGICMSCHEVDARLLRDVLWFSHPRRTRSGELQRRQRFHGCPRPLASTRRQHALSINWGSWIGVGMAASLDDSHRRRWAALGALPIEPSAGVEMLIQLIRANRHVVAMAQPLHRASPAIRLAALLCGFERPTVGRLPIRRHRGHARGRLEKTAACRGRRRAPSTAARLLGGSGRQGARAWIGLPHRPAAVVGGPSGWTR